VENFIDLFSGDAFTLQSLTAAINDIDHVPDRAGRLVFSNADVARPVNTLDRPASRPTSASNVAPWVGPTQ
jgi:hypothetical protein